MNNINSPSKSSVNKGSLPDINQNLNTKGKFFNLKDTKDGDVLLNTMNTNTNTNYNRTKTLISTKYETGGISSFASPNNEAFQNKARMTATEQNQFDMNNVNEIELAENIDNLKSNLRETGKIFI